MDGARVSWTPDAATVERANVTRLMRRKGFASYDDLYRWTLTDRPAFWDEVVTDLGIVFQRPPDEVVADVADPEQVTWLPGAKMNIAESCFVGDANAPAIAARVRGGVEWLSRGELQRRVFRFANGWRAAGWRVGTRAAIAMPMTVEAVTAYLGIVWAGGVVVSVADSFAPEEIATRLRIADADIVVTQDRILRGGKELPMYRKVVEAGAAHAIVISTGADLDLRPGDIPWTTFLGDETPTPAVACEPDTFSNILFSSGTTGEPKAIPWTHTTPIKSAMDGRYHHDIHPDDVVAWPTNLGWMMGPWLIYSSLLNGAALALYDDAPTDRGFIDFVVAAGVTVLGVVPSLVAAWRSADALDGVDLSGVRVMSSTGEASSASDMAWLMRATGAPMIEYCGGTEIGGGFLAGTVLHPALPAMFTTPTLGTEIVLLDEEASESSSGEVFLVPPVVGLSQQLLNRDHHEEYYAGTPSRPGRTLRRHGDHIERLDGGYFQAHGRVDDTMNLGGIKVGSAEIERVAGHVDGAAEVAAIAAEPAGGGPSRLVLFVVPEPGFEMDADAWRTAVQAEIRTHLNPLFKVHEVVVADRLPRTASAKVMRRTLRAEYPG
jgi:acetyl-CoA synthetase